MCLFTHIAAGALAGAMAPNVYVAPFFGLGSHILLDVLPHYDFDSMKIELLLAGAVIAVLAIGGVFSAVVLLGVAFAILPDFENLLWKLGHITDEQKRFPGHVGFIRHGGAAGFGNLALQFIGSAVVVFYLIRRAV